MTKGTEKALGKGEGRALAHTLEQRTSGSQEFDFWAKHVSVNGLFTSASPFSDAGDDVISQLLRLGFESPDLGFLNENFQTAHV